MNTPPIPRVENVGFTGTQRGMTDAQKDKFAGIFAALNPVEFHHGDCVGADSDAHDIAVAWNPEQAVIIHPPTNDAKRAFNKAQNIHYREPKPYLDRNKDIVAECHLMIACPGEKVEELRSGTWATMRNARKNGVPLYTIFPDGEVLFLQGR